MTSMLSNRTLGMIAKGFDGMGSGRNDVYGNCGFNSVTFETMLSYCFIYTPYFGGGCIRYKLNNSGTKILFYVSWDDIKFYFRRDDTKVNESRLCETKTILNFSKRFHGFKKSFNLSYIDIVKTFNNIGFNYAGVSSVKLFIKEYIENMLDYTASDEDLELIEDSYSRAVDSYLGLDDLKLTFEVESFTEKLYKEYGISSCLTICEIDMSDCEDIRVYSLPDRRNPKKRCILAGCSLTTLVGNMRNRSDAIDKGITMGFGQLFINGDVIN